MRADFYGLAFETPRVTVFLRSPWRSSYLEHRLFDAARGLPRVEPEGARAEMFAEAEERLPGCLVARANELIEVVEAADEAAAELEVIGGDSFVRRDFGHVRALTEFVGALTDALRGRAGAIGHDAGDIADDRLEMRRDQADLA